MAGLGLFEGGNEVFDRYNREPKFCQDFRNTLATN